MTHKIRRKLIPVDELAKTIIAEVNAGAAGLRGRKLRKFKEWAYQWWKDALMKEDKSK